VSVTLQKLNNLKEKLSASNIELDEESNEAKHNNFTVSNVSNVSNNKNAKDYKNIRDNKEKVMNNLNEIEINDNHLKDFNLKRIKEKLFKGEKIGNVMKTDFSGINNNKDFDNDRNDRNDRSDNSKKLY